MPGVADVFAGSERQPSAISRRPLRGPSQRRREGHAVIGGRPGEPERPIAHQLGEKSVGRAALHRPHGLMTADTTNCPETAMKLPGGGHENCPLTVMRSARHEFRLPRRVPRLRPLLGCGCGAKAPTAPRRDTVKSAEEIMNMLDAFDLTGSLRDAGELAGVSHHTVARYVAVRESGLAVRGVRRPMLIDEFLPKVEEWVDRSNGKVRADVAHDKLVVVGFTGSERATRGAVAAAQKNYRLGRVRVHRPWVTEPGQWLQYDFGDGPGHRRGQDDVVLCVAGVVAVPGGVGYPGQDRPERDGGPGRDAAPPGWGADVPVDRQREDGDHRACRRYRGP